MSLRSWLGFVSLIIVFLNWHGILIQPSIQVIDRTAPVVIAQAILPSNGAYTPGAPIAVTFNEEIDCIRPYKFSASLLIAASTTVTVVPTMFCVLNKIELQIPASVVVCWPLYV